MGHLQATEMAEFAGLDAGLYWHLRSNHYPPVHPVFTDVAKQAIEVAVEAQLDEDYAALEETVVMPNGIVKSYGDIVDELHLDAFVLQRLSELIREESES